MKFVKDLSPKGLLLPTAAMKMAGFEAGKKVEYHALDGAVVALKGRMTAMELLTAAQSLQALAEELYSHLDKVCGPCEGCEGGCPYADLDDPGIQLPDYLRQEAGIPENAKLCADTDEETGQVVIYDAGYRYDLRDVPRNLLERFVEKDICLCELEERLIVEDTVYGE